MSTPAYDASEMMAVAAARRLADGAVCFVGIGLPSKAANLARATHAPDCVLIYESGTIGAKPRHLPLSIGDGELAETADAVVSVPEIFSYWLQGGRIDVGFLGAAQIDRYGNLNSTVIGPYEHPEGAPAGRRRCAGDRGVVQGDPGDAEPVAADVRRASSTSARPSATATARALAEQLGMAGRGVTAVITDLGILEPDPETCELTLTRVHPGVEPEQVQEATGWQLRIAADVEVGDAPTEAELEALRALKTADEVGVTG